MHVIKRDGSTEPFDFAKIERLNEFATEGLNVDVALLKSQIRFQVYDGMKTSEIFEAQVKAASDLISIDNPDMTYVAARYKLADLYKRVAGDSRPHHLRTVIDAGVADGRYSEAMATKFDLDILNAALDHRRDLKFDYFGLQNVADRYLMRLKSGDIIELPQHWLMRVAMGLALDEQDPTSRAIEFYALLSAFDGMSSTPTLFNSGTRRSQMSSCYLNLAADQISVDDEEMDEGENRFASIYGVIEESARLSKFAGGIGTSWTPVRGAGSHIHGTNGKSSGVVPYLKVYNDTAVAVNQGGKRKGSFAPYLEPWHSDFWAFCELKKEFGEERLRAHDIFPAAWIPDLFMQRVEDNGVWSFFDSGKYPELHNLWGDEFKARYEQLEGEGAFTSQRPAMEVWKHMLACLFETGHPWITFKDECNRRSPQRHAGTIHSSNLCTEITLNTSDDETAVCNLASINIARHVKDGKVDFDKLKVTVGTMMRMLDNVIDLNYYPSNRAQASNMRHRPVGLGMMGESEALVACGIDWESKEHLDWLDEVWEHTSYYAIEASMLLAKERGRYQSFEGSAWSRGEMPWMNARGDFETTLDWSSLALKVRAFGMRNSNCMAIAPTATISIIVATTPCTEPIFERTRLEGNISGYFSVIDPCLRYGRPELVKTVWEIHPTWIVKAGARRQRWIDQAQSLTIFARQGTRGRDLDEIYRLAWKLGCKTTYYLRGQSKDEAAKANTEFAALAPPPTEDQELNLCSIDNPSCESCQ